MVIRPCAGRSAKRTLNVINYEQNATSLCRLHVATQAREPASLHCRSRWHIHVPREPEEMSFFEELKRRNVFRVGVAYGVAAWVILQVADMRDVEKPIKPMSASWLKAVIEVGSWHRARLIVK